MDECPQAAPSGTSPAPLPESAPASSPATSVSADTPELEAQRRLREDTGAIEPIDEPVIGPAESDAADDRFRGMPAAAPAARAGRPSSPFRLRIAAAAVVGLAAVVAVAVAVPGSGSREGGRPDAVSPTTGSTAEAGRPSPTPHPTGTGGTTSPSASSVAADDDQDGPVPSAPASAASPPAVPDEVFDGAGTTGPSGSPADETDEAPVRGRTGGGRGTAGADTDGGAAYGAANWQSGATDEQSGGSSEEGSSSPRQPASPSTAYLEKPPTPTQEASEPPSEGSE